MKKILQIIEFIIFVIFFNIFKMLPLKFASRIGGYILKMIGPLTKSNKTSLKNLNKIYSEKDRKEIAAISKKSWENLGKTFAEFSHLKKIISKDNGYISIDGINYLNQIKNKKEQAIFIAIHQSNWEIIGPIIIENGLEINSVYRHINNPLINKFVLKVRKKLYSSSKLSPKGKKSAQDMLRSIKEGLSLGLLIDQRDSSGIKVPFLGKSALTQIGFIKLSKKFNLKIYPIENQRIGETDFKIIIHNPINLKIIKNKSENQIINEIYDVIGKWINKYPENWLWQHNRWEL